MSIPLARYWALLVDYLRPQARTFALVCGLLLASIGLQVVIPLVTRYFIDTAQAGGTDQALLLAALGFLGLAIVQQVVGVGAAYFGEVVAWGATNELRAGVAEHCLGLDMSFHNARSPGELIERIDGDVNALAQFFSQLVIVVVGNLLLLVGILLVPFLEEWRVGLAFSAFSASTIWILNRLREIAVPHEKDRRQANAELFGFLEERLSGTEDIRSSGAVDYVLTRLSALQRVVLSTWKKVQIRYWAIGSVGTLLVMLSWVVAFVAGYYLYNTAAITMGTAYLFVQYAILLARPFHELTQQVETLQGVGASIERIEELLAIESRIQDGPGDARLPEGALSLRFDDVSFEYKEGVPVLENVSLELGAGRVLGILGRTGSGKTTLTRLIFRLYDPRAGAIDLGGVDIRNPRLADLRSRVGVVTQDVQLFEASVRDNLTFFSRDVPDERIVEVIRQLELGAWFDALPRGLDTRLETRGRSLSAGEAQLLAFARVFLRDPGLVILDEASSRLDLATEQRIERALHTLLENRTALIVAHRLATVQRADDVMILEAGRVVESGARAGLAADAGSRFAGLLRAGLEEVLA